MKLKLLREREILTAIRKEFSDMPRDLILGIGDDAAVIKTREKYLILTKDLLIEDYHFIVSFHPPYFLGRKSLNVNLSDVAAMGGKPRYALLGLAFPEKTPTRWVEEFFAGFKSAAEEWKVTLAGGDISQSKKIAVSVTVLGEGKTIIRRDGAKPGHLLFVSGNLGDSQQGLILLRKKFKPEDDELADPLLKAFLDPTPQVSLGQGLSRLKMPSAMIDISDGLSVDLMNLCQESGCGAEIEEASLPLSFGLCYWQRKPYELALHGGEDYQLLFSVPLEKLDFMAQLQKKYKITCIGKMTKEKGIFLIDKDGKKKPLEIKGFEHFT